jgi:hypothetical protein
MFPKRLLTLRGNADKPSMSADIFESLIDMAGVSFPGHDPDRSLFSTEWRYRPRIVNPIWQTDFDKAIFDKKCEIVLPPHADARHLAPTDRERSLTMTLAGAPWSAASCFSHAADPERVQTAA